MPSQHHPGRLRAPQGTRRGRLHNSNLRRVAIEHRQFVRALHPADAFGHLNMSLCGQDIRVVIGRALDVDDAGQDGGIGIEKSRAAIGAELPPAIP